MIRPQIQGARAEQSKQPVQPGQVHAAPVPDEGVSDPDHARQAIGQRLGGPARVALGRLNVEEERRRVHGHPMGEPEVYWMGIYGGDIYRVVTSDRANFCRSAAAAPPRA